MSEVSSRDSWIFDKCKSIITDKDAMFRQVVNEMLNKTTSMFKYNGLPETIKQKDLELQLQVNGYCIAAKVKDNLYTFTGGLGGEPNPYYLPTIATVANPALKFTENLKIGEQCVVVLNDYLYQGLMPLYSKYGGLLTEAEISLRYAIINARVPALIEADNDGTYESAKNYFAKIVEGKDYGIIASGEFYDGIRSHDFYKQAYIKDIIESIQYIKGSWYNAIGLNAAFNMKREAINEAEATLNEDILVPSIDTMLECRKDGVNRINEMFGTNITVELNSVWAQNDKQNEYALKIEKNEAEGGDTE